jgi:hypothetical protein
LPDFPWYKIPKWGKIFQNDHKLYQRAIKYFQWPQNRPIEHKIDQDFPSQDPPKFTQIWIFGLKTNHLATLTGSVPRTKGQGRFLNRVQVENFASSKLEVNKFIPIKFATRKFST